MPNSVRCYHEATSYQRNAMAGAYLDWSNQPGVFKRYPNAPKVPLPTELEFPSVGMQELMRDHHASKTSPVWDLEKLSGILRLTCAITAKSSHPGGDFFYRSTPSAGALYPCEIYLAASGIKGLPAALYHYNLEEHSLVKLRPLEPQESGGSCSLIFFISVIFFRSSWKYRERAYRYLLLDSGHVLENLILALKATCTPHRTLLDFQDEKVNSFLGLESREEVCLAMVEAGDLRSKASPFTEAVSESPYAIPKPEPPAPRETIYPAILEAHAAGCRPMHPGEGPVLRMLEQLGPALGPPQLLEAPQPRPDEMGYVESLWRRRSKRAYLSRPMDKNSFCCLMECLNIHETFSWQKWNQLLAIGLVVRDVEGLDCGFYLLDAGQGAIREAARGDFFRGMASACLDQAWMAQAALQVLFLSNLEILESRMGPRAYRHVMILSGRLGQRIYLASTALGLGACGVGAFYDQEAASLLGLNESSRLLYVVTSGPVRSLASLAS